MTVLEFRTADLGRIVEHALAATDDREGFNDDGSGAGLILVADPGGVFLMSNGTPPLVQPSGGDQIAFALGGDPARDPDWAGLVVEICSGAGEFRALCNWARMIRHISKSADSIRVKVKDGSAELLYDPPSGNEPATEETET
jgi:hypothetical protein